jgi:hypothetical protein
MVCGSHGLLEDDKLQCGRYGSTFWKNLLWLSSGRKSKEKFAASLFRAGRREQQVPQEDLYHLNN